MTEPCIPKTFGRQAFGSDPAGYHRSRPAYPEWVYEVLRSLFDADRHFATFEIGAGTGTATRWLLEIGADPLVAIEPDGRLADFLRKNNPDLELTVLESTFEAVGLNEGGFDLGVCATAFHWLDEDESLEKIARLLRPGGWWAAFWNVFGDASRPDPFHEATLELLAAPASPSAGDHGIPFGLDSAARLAALRRSGAFDVIDHRSSCWSLVLDPDETVELYATFSNVNARADCESVLAELRRIALETFGGRVVRNMTTSLYVARRSG